MLLRLALLLGLALVDQVLGSAPSERPARRRGGARRLPGSQERRGGPPERQAEAESEPAPERATVAAVADETKGALASPGIIVKARPQEPVMAVCTVCGVTFASARGARYCSKSCNNRSWYRRAHDRVEPLPVAQRVLAPAPAAPVCQQCGARLASTRHGRRYCGRKCRQQAWREGNTASLGRPRRPRKRQAGQRAQNGGDLSPTEASYLRGKRYNAEKMTPQQRNERVAASRTKNKNETGSRKKDEPRQTANRLAPELGTSPATIASDGIFAVAVDTIAANVGEDIARRCPICVAPIPHGSAETTCSPECRRIASKMMPEPQSEHVATYIRLLGR